MNRAWEYFGTVVVLITIVFFVWQHFEHELVEKRISTDSLKASARAAASNRAFIKDVVLEALSEHDKKGCK